MNRNKKKSAKLTKSNSNLNQLRLFVAGATDRSRLAVLQVRESCDQKIPNQYTLTVIDIYQQPKLAKENQIVVTPTLIQDTPLPVNRFIGNMKNICDRIGRGGASNLGNRLP